MTQITGRGWCPFADHKPIAKCWKGNKGRLAVVDHIAQGSYSGTIGWFLGASEASAHFLLGPAGELTQFVSILDSAWANGLRYSNGDYIDPSGHVVHPDWVELRPGRPGFAINPNWTTISIERAGNSGDPWSSETLDRHAQLLAWIAAQYPALAPYTPLVSLIGHSHISPIDKKFCPGPTADYTALARVANRRAEVVALPAAPPGYSVQSPLLGTPKATPAQVVAYSLKRGGIGEYTAADIRDVIVPTYFAIATRVGIDPVIALAQAIHETDNFGSYWAARPRRNPAGIGVTGVPGAGVHFPSWKQDAIPAHLGRLLAYALRASEATPTQAGLIAEALRWQSLPMKYRGIAKVVQGLTARWATDPAYASHIVAIAEDLRTVVAR